MRTLTSSTGKTRHAPAVGEGTLCNGIGAARGNVRWYDDNGDVTCKRCLKLLPGVIAEAWTMAHATADILIATAATVTGAVQVSPATAPDRADTIRTAHRAGLLHTTDGATFTLTDAGRRAAGPNQVEPVTVEDIAEWQVDDEEGGTGEVEPADRPAEVRHAAETIRQNMAATVTRTRVAIGTQIGEACAALGIELGHGTRKGLPCYVVNGQQYSAGELADLVLEGGFEGAYGRAETIVRQDSPLRFAGDPRAAELVELVSLPTRDTGTHGDAPFTLTEAAGKIMAEYGDALKTLGAEEYAAELESNRASTLTGRLASLNRADRERPTWKVANNGTGERIWFVLRRTPGGPNTHEYHEDVNRKLIRYTLAGAVAKAEELNAAGARSKFSDPYPVGTALRIKDDGTTGTLTGWFDGGRMLVTREDGTEWIGPFGAVEYRPAIGEWVVGTLTSAVTGKRIGGPVIGVFEGVDTRYGLASLKDGHAMLAVDIDSMRPAPQVPDASHLIGCTLTAELATGDHSLRTGVVASVLCPSADGRYVVVQFEKPTTWVVRVPVGVVERTASMTVSRVEKLPASEGVECWGVRVQPKSTMVNLVVTPANPYTPHEVDGVFYIHDVRYPATVGTRWIRNGLRRRVSWGHRAGAVKACAELWAAEQGGLRKQGDEWF